MSRHCHRHHGHHHGSARVLEVCIKIVLYSLATAVGLIVLLGSVLAGLTHAWTERQGRKAAMIRNTSAYRRV
jgi:hypothetical protein